ncbi:MAG: HDOD domain-containing protein [Planctomycetota bacterium]
MRQFAEIVDADPASPVSSCNSREAPLRSIAEIRQFAGNRLLGIALLLSISLGISLFQCMKRAASLDQTWCRRRVLFNAVAGRELSRLARRSTPEQAFLTAMIRISRPASAPFNNGRENTANSWTISNHPNRSPVLEAETLGYNHSIVTEALLQHWQFPEENIEAAAHHHDVPTYSKLEIMPLLVCAEAYGDFLLSAHATYRFFEKRLRKLKLENSIPEFLKSIVEGAQGTFSTFHCRNRRRGDASKVLDMEEAERKSANATMRNVPSRWVVTSTSSSPHAR